MVSAAKVSTVRILGTHGVPAAYGGFETAAQNVGQYLRDHGWRVIVYCQVPGVGPIETDEWQGLHRVRIPEPRDGWLGTSSFDLKSVRHALRHRGPREAWLTFGYNTGVFDIVPRLRGIPNVINMDGMEWTRARWGLAKQGILLCNERIAGLVGDVLIADHPEIARYLKRHFGSRRVTTIAYGAHEVVSAPTAPAIELGLVPGNYAIVVCRPIPENSILEIVSAWSQRRRDKSLLVVGPYTDTDPYHRKVIAAASSEIIFPGAIFDTMRLSALRFHAALYLHGHTVGGTNPSLVEAMAASNPVVAHDNQYNRWVAGTGNAYFSSENNLATLLDELLDDSQRLAAMGEFSRDRYRAEFTWERIGDQYEQALLSALSKADESRFSVSPAAARTMPSTATERRRDPEGSSRVVNVAVVGLGKMGLSHLSMINAHPSARVVGVCDATKYLRDVLNKYTGVPTYADFAGMLDQAKPDAVIIATPTHLHGSMVREALERGIHVFCEKPLYTDPAESVALTALAAERNVVTQVGYHNRFVASFGEVRRLLNLGAIGPVNTALAEAYGPVVLKPSGQSWRSQRTTGGGSLYDYAAHPLNLLTWYLGEPVGVSGGALTSVFSAEIDDAVAATMYYPTGTAQLCVNWSDESQRKMTTKITLWGTHGRIYADRQEIQVYLRDTAPIPDGYRAGWNVRYTTDMAEAPWFYLRGEEYSAQLDAFVQRASVGKTEGENDFASATLTDRVLAAISDDAARQVVPIGSGDGNAIPRGGGVAVRQPTRIGRVAGLLRNGASPTVRAKRERISG
jgi:predicted dehydrogenase/glycosyltransferase involved in cell wall biosynthesis